VQAANAVAKCPWWYNARTGEPTLVAAPIIEKLAKLVGTWETRVLPRYAHDRRFHQITDCYGLSMLPKAIRHYVNQSGLLLDDPNAYQKNLVLKEALRRVRESYGDILKVLTTTEQCALVMSVRSSSYDITTEEAMVFVRLAAQAPPNDVHFREVNASDSQNNIAVDRLRVFIVGGVGANEKADDHLVRVTERDTMCVVPANTALALLGRAWPEIVTVLADADDMRHSIVETVFQHLDYASRRILGPVVDTPLCIHLECPSWTSPITLLDRHYVGTHHETPTQWTNWVRQTTDSFGITTYCVVFDDDHDDNLNDYLTFLHLCIDSGLWEWAPLGTLLTQHLFLRDASSFGYLRWIGETPDKETTVHHSYQTKEIDWPTATQLR